jgi:hypothetical protein
VSYTTLHLDPAEAQALFKPVVGSGGFQNMQRKLNNALTFGAMDASISLSDAELGAVVRHMAYSRSGGFEGRLRKAFGRSLREIVEA